MRLLFFFFLLGWLGTTEMEAQRFLQMERSGSYKVKRYYPGETLTFRLTDDPNWYTEDIREVLLEDNLVVFSNRVVPLTQITHLRSFKMRRWSKPVGQQLYNFGAAWLLFTLGDALVTGNPLPRSVVEVPLSSAALGFLIQKLFRRRTFKMGKNRRLRLLDLTF